MRLLVRLAPNGARRTNSHIIKKRIILSVENLILCVLLWEDLLHFPLKLSF